MKLVMPARHESVSKLDAISTCRCTTLVKHMNEQHHPFTGCLMIFTSNGPKKSTPVLANGNTLPQAFLLVGMPRRFELLQLVAFSL